VSGESGIAQVSFALTCGIRCHNGLDRLQSVEISHVSCYPGVTHRHAPKPLIDLKKLGPQAPKHDICI
jgi:hypothetical protein